MFDQLFPLIPDAGATIVLIVFFILWHKRTMARDKQFNETTREIVTALMECMSKHMDKPTPRS